MNIRSIQFDTLDYICWKHYGHTNGTVEAVLQANPGLAQLGEILPTGTLIELPSITEKPSGTMIRLWD